MVDTTRLVAGLSTTIVRVLARTHISRPAAPVLFVVVVPVQWESTWILKREPMRPDHVHNKLDPVVVHVA